MPTASVPVTEEVVRDILNTILDPCSVNAGAPGGLVDMGLVRSVAVEDGPDGFVIHARLCVTEPSCIMGHLFVREARERLGPLAGVAHLDIAMDPSLGWNESKMAPELRQRLEAARAQRRLAAPTRKPA